MEAQAEGLCSQLCNALHEEAKKLKQVQELAYPVRARVAALVHFAGMVSSGSLGVTYVASFFGVMKCMEDYDRFNASRNEDWRQCDATIHRLLEDIRDLAAHFPEHVCEICNKHGIPIIQREDGSFSVNWLAMKFDYGLWL